MKNFLISHPELEQYYLLIAQGQIFLRPAAVVTVLGSCVSVTFHSPKRKIGGIFHALLARSGDYVSKSPPEDPFRFVATGIHTLWAELLRMGVDRKEVECKIFGGANALLDGEMAVGKKNALTAFETLAELGLRVLASHVGGDRGRKLLFLPHTGEVYMKTLTNTFASNNS